MIELYSANTPNGIKVPIALEELGVEYRLITVNLAAAEQKQPAFLSHNHNGRIPLLVDFSRAVRPYSSLAFMSAPCSRSDWTTSP